MAVLATVREQIQADEIEMSDKDLLLKMLEKMQSAIELENWRRLQILSLNMATKAGYLGMEKKE